MPSLIRVGVPAVVGAAAWALARQARTATVRDRLRAHDVRTTSWLPAAVRAPLLRSLERAGVQTEPVIAVQVWAIAVGAAIAISLPFGATFVIVVALVALVGPPAALFSARHRGRRRFDLALPDALRSLAADVRAGATLRGAIGRVSTSPSAVAPDFARIAARLRLGASVTDALHPWVVERSNASVRVVVGALGCVDAVGGAPGPALEGLAASLSDRVAVAAEARAQSAQARISAIVVGLAPLGYLVFSAAIDAAAVRALIERPLSRVCFLIAIGLDLLAVEWMRRIVRDPEDAT